MNSPSQSFLDDGDGDAETIMPFFSACAAAAILMRFLNNKYVRGFHSPITTQLADYKRRHGLFVG
jgi:hypothetical protein